jgi:cysteine-rich repeat protein
MKRWAAEKVGTVKRRILLGFLSVAVLVAGLTVPTGQAEAQLFNKEQVRCRTRIVRATKRYFETSSRARRQCVQRIIDGFISPETSCIDGKGDAKLEAQLTSAEALVGRTIPRACASVNLIFLGFPGVCRDETGLPFDTRDLEACIISNGGAIASALLDNNFPEIDGLVRGKDAVCLQGAAARASAQTNRDFRARAKCLLRQEKRRLDADAVDCRADIPPYGPGTEDTSTDTHITNAYVHILSGVPSVCAAADIVGLGYPKMCANPTGEDFNLFDMKQCLLDVNRVGVQDLLDIPFPREPVCGDAILAGDEECDDGFESHSDTRPDACRTDCTLPICPDGVADPSNGEECDDGNSDAGDGCGPTCLDERCGDDIINNNGTEQCDDGGLNSDSAADACRTNCELPSCGDSVQDDGEICDDGNTVSEDGCRADCLAIETCGDGVQQGGLGEACDNGLLDNSDSTPDACRVDCQLPSCGDAVTDPSNSEECDDANSVDGDDCSNLCQVCGNGNVSGDEECDDGVTNNSDVTPDACRTSCRLAGCGDGVMDASEQCDDENLSDNDICTNLCQINVCGDGSQCTDAFLCNSGPTGGLEECDNGDSNSDVLANACREDCSLPVCGDNVADDGEICDGTDRGTCPSNEACVDGCACKGLCPGFAEATLFAGTGRSCSTDADCPKGACDETLLRCVTSARLDSGWTGLGHKSDINDDSTVRAFLDCPDPGPICTNDCTITGLDPSDSSCRCLGDNQTVCDKPFQNDAENCGGGACQCYFGAPFPLSSGGVPVCVVNRLRSDLTGTANVETGESLSDASLATSVYSGLKTWDPCPMCAGVCEGDTDTICQFNDDCGVEGTCLFDPVPRDGVRGGVCNDGANLGESCDIQSRNESFPARSSTGGPAPGGGGYSLDCFPDPLKNLSPSGLKIDLTQTTGDVSLGFDVTCGRNPNIRCACRMCSVDVGASCTSDDDCADQSHCALDPGISCDGDEDCASVGGACTLSTCSDNGGGKAPQPNECNLGLCSPIDGTLEQGLCPNGPINATCDGVVRANGEGILACSSDAACDESVVGIDAGACTIARLRECFLDPIIASGIPAPNDSVGVAVFCIPPTASAGINGVAGLPGPARVINELKTKAFCVNDPDVEYEAGVGGCPTELTP